MSHYLLFYYSYYFITVLLITLLLLLPIVGCFRFSADHKIYKSSLIINSDLDILRSALNRKKPTIGNKSNKVISNTVIK